VAELEISVQTYGFKKLAEAFQIGGVKSLLVKHCRHRMPIEELNIFPRGVTWRNQMDQEIGSLENGPVAKRLVFLH
jgi:hypothetical protein